MHSLAHGRALADVCVVAVAGSFEGELRSSQPGCVGCCSRPQTAKEFQAFPASLWPQRLLFLSFPPFSLCFLASLVFPSFPPPEALLGGALEKESESGSVGQLRQQARPGCSRCGTGALLLLQSIPAHSNVLAALILVSLSFLSAVFNILSCFHTNTLAVF